MFTPITIIIAACVVGIITLQLLPSNIRRAYQVVGLWTGGIACWLGGVIFCNFNLEALQFQFLSVTPWLAEMNIDVNFGLDGISFVFLALTAVLFPFCILASWNLKQGKILFTNLLLIELFLILTFTTLDIFLFCLFFESLLIPMFFIILFWGSRDRRIKALTYFVLYTLFGSIFLITAIFLLYTELNSTSFGDILSGRLPYDRQCIFWMLLFITFSIKIPMFPFHIWLPEAHVEAPTVGSVILAGLLLKLGAYGMLRFLFLFDAAKTVFQPFVLTLCLISIFIGSFIAVRQLDLKRIVAYSSIAHMNFALLGFFANNLFSMTGGTILMVSHGFVSSALFLLIGVIYDRYHTRSVLYYGGLAMVMPLFATFLFIFIISNFSFPGSSNFVGELLVLIGLGMSPTKLVFVLAAISTFYGLVYSLIIMNRILFGWLKFSFFQKFTDISRREYSMFLVLAVLSTLLGFAPNYVIEPITFGVSSLTHNLSAVIDSVEVLEDATREVVNKVKL